MEKNLKKQKSHLTFHPQEDFSITHNHIVFFFSQKDLDNF